jgi:integrase
MPTMPAKGLDRFVDTLTWKKALKDTEHEHQARLAKRNAKQQDGVETPYQALKPPRQVSYLHYMERGLSLMLVLSYGGTKSWRALTYRDGKPHYWKLGTYPQMTVKQARAKAQEYFKDPQKVEDAAEVGTFKDVAENWFARYVLKERKLRSAPEIRRQLDKYVYPKWGSKKFLDIRRKTVTELLDWIKDNHSAAMADYVLATIRSIMTWQQKREDDYVSPIVKGMRQGNGEARSRILNENEIRRVWHAADENGTFGALVKMLLLTAQRREKVTTMRWDDVVDGVWTIRAEEREKGTPGALKLPQAALDVIAAQPRIAGNPYVFAGSLRGRRPRKDTPKKDLPTGPAAFNSFSQRKAELEAKLADMSHWTLHDLRRTARWLMAEAGVSENAAERVLGHALPGVRGVYNRYDYADEKADALQRLAMKIETIVHPPSSKRGEL